MERRRLRHEHPAIRPLPPVHLYGPGRDRRFELPQYMTTVDGIRTVFFDEGEGPVLFFIHGLAGNTTFWVNVAPYFLDRCRVVGLDLVGCGESDKPTDSPYSIRRFTEHVRALMDRLGIERATLVGHSMGGMVATDFGLTYPDRVDNLVLLNPAGFLPMPWWMRHGGQVLMRPVILNAILPRIWRWILRNVFYNDNAFTEAFIRTVDETYAPDDIFDLSWIMCELRKDLLNLNFYDQLPHLDVPVYLQWGSEDRLVPSDNFHEAARVLPHVTTDEIMNCGHMPTIERPDRTLALLEQVLDG